MKSTKKIRENLNTYEREYLFIYKNRRHGIISKITETTVIYYHKNICEKYKIPYKPLAAIRNTYMNTVSDIERNAGNNDKYTEILTDHTLDIHYKNYVSIDISNANYTISNGDANSYYYGYIKFTSPKGNTYFFTGYSPSGDWNGYFVPTASGLALNCEYGGRKTFLLNTEKKSKLVENESLMLSDVFFNKYLKQASVNYTYKGIKFTGNGNKKYTITIPNLYHKEVSNFGKISENYSQSGQSSSGQWECISVGSNGYYWLKNQKNREATNVAIDEKNNITITYNDMTIQINVNK